MKRFILIPVTVMAACSAAPHAEDATPTTSNSPSAPAHSVASASNTPATPGLADLNAMTFECPKAALNAAAREAAKAPSQGTYQFSYFHIIHDAHHAFYEVHFKSNYQGEPELKYCVSMYCQQGWDPRTTKTEITLMSNQRRHGAPAQTSTCGVHSAHGKRKR